MAGGFPQFTGPLVPLEDAMHSMIVGDSPSFMAAARARASRHVEMDSIIAAIVRRHDAILRVLPLAPLHFSAAWGGLFNVAGYAPVPAVVYWAAIAAYVHLVLVEQSAHWVMPATAWSRAVSISDAITGVVSPAALAVFTLLTGLSSWALLGGIGGVALVLSCCTMCVMACVHGRAISSVFASRTDGAVEVSGLLSSLVGGGQIVQAIINLLMVGTVLLAVFAPASWGGVRNGVGHLAGTCWPGSSTPCTPSQYPATAAWVLIGLAGARVLYIIAETAIVQLGLTEPLVRPPPPVLGAAGGAGGGGAAAPAAADHAPLMGGRSDNEKMA